MRFIVFGILATLTACAGGGSQSGQHTDFEDSADTFSKLTTKMFSGDLLEIQSADLPVSGTASFSGPIEIVEYTGTSAVGFLLYGTLNLDADFAANTIDGVADKFISVGIDYDSGKVSVEDLYGTLDVSGGKIGAYVNDDFDGVSMTGTLDGYDLGYVDIDAVLNGSFYSYGGNAPDVVFGQGEGTSRSDSRKSEVYVIFFGE